MEICRKHPENKKEEMLREVTTMIQSGYDLLYGEISLSGS